MSRIFDTYKTSVEFDEFIANFIPEGYIIVAACKDDCVTSLSTKGKQWFASMGSLEIWKLAYRESFAFIGKIKGKGQIGFNEKRSEKKEDAVSVTQVFDIEHFFAGDNATSSGGAG